jgi:hypothetical protein
MKVGKNFTLLEWNEAIHAECRTRNSHLPYSMNARVTSLIRVIIYTRKTFSD